MFSFIECLEKYPVRLSFVVDSDAYLDHILSSIEPSSDLARISRFWLQQK